MEFKCKYCSRSCATKSGLWSHETSCGRKNNIKNIAIKPQNIAVKTQNAIQNMRAKNKGYSEIDNEDDDDNNVQQWWETNPEKLEEFINIRRRIIMNKYSNRSVMYLIIILLENEPKIICKVGYSSKFEDRFVALKQKYNAKDIILIGLKAVNNESQEKAFHKMMEQQRKESKYHGVKGDTELYVYDDNVQNEFNAVIDKLDYIELGIDEYERLKKNSAKWEHTFKHFHEVSKI